MNKTINGITCVTKNVQAKTTIVLVHGYNSSSETFANFFKETNNFNLLAINYPGNVKSKSNGNFSIKEIANQIDQIVNKLNTKVILMGHSFGGAVIAEMKNKFKIKGYAFVSSFTKSILDSALHKALLSTAKFENKLSLLKPFVALTASRMNIEREWILDFLVPKEGFKKVYKENIVQKTYIRNELHENIKNIKKTKYAFIGSKDKIIPVNAYKEYFNEMNVETKVINGSGHNPFKTGSKEISNYLNEEIKFRKKILKIKILN